MEIKDINTYEGWKAKQSDEYGRCVFRYVERWATLMELDIKQGLSVRDIAESKSHEADTEGITGFMYGCAVSILSQCWTHGEELRKWHNKEYNYEGEGTVNPALLTIVKK